MTVKKCDICGAIYEAGFVLTYNIDSYITCGANSQLKREFYKHIDLCKTCKEKFEYFITPTSQEEEED